MTTINQDANVSMKTIADRTKYLVHGYIRKTCKKIKTIIPESVIQLCILFLYTIDDISIKVTCIGNGTVGKTCMIMSYVFKQFPPEYIPLVFNQNDYGQDIKILSDGYEFELNWQDTGHGEYERIHIMNHYPGTDILLICFSIISKSSMERVKEKWIKHREMYMTDVPFILIGTKIDLRYDEDVIQKVGHVVTHQQGQELAAEIGADEYMECSALKQKGLDKIMEAICKLYLKSRGLGTYNKRKKDCVLL